MRLSFFVSRSGYGTWSQIRDIVNNKQIVEEGLFFMKISDFDQLKRVSKYGGVYLLWDKEDIPLYIGHTFIFGERFPTHYYYLKSLVHSISIFPTNEHRLLEYTLIKRVNPIHNRDREWNRITRGRYGSKPYLLSENSYWGHKFFKKEYLPFKINSQEDRIYLDGVDRLIKELKRLSKRT